MSNIAKNYSKILNVINSFNLVPEPKRMGRKPKMSDIEVVALSLTAEFLSIDSENALFKQVTAIEIPHLLERSQFNKRRRRLFHFSERIRQYLFLKLAEFEDYFIVDSMPLEICKMARHNRVKICKEDYLTSPEKGFCASQNIWFYGYKLHGTCSLSGVFQSIDITKANVHDIHFLEDIKHQLSDCVLLGDKGYLSVTQQLDLFETANIKLETPMRSNQKIIKSNPIFSGNQGKESKHCFLNYVTNLW